VSSIRCLVARTGYTGEDGFELYCDSVEAETLWNALLESGGPAGLEPAGLGARDTLRLEKAYPLYGHELDDTTTPLEAGLEWVTKLAKGPFVGREVLLKQKAAGIRRKLVGLELLDPGIARAEYALFKDGKPIGRVTSGTKSPTLAKAIALAYVTIEESALDNTVEVEIRGRKTRAKIVPLPFYRR
jgi:aminomethyltransferase